MIDTRRGFTLIEMCISMSILAIALASVLVFLGGTLTIVGKSKEVQIATDLARKQVEFVKNVNFPPTRYDRSDAEFNVEGDNADETSTSYTRDTWNGDIDNSDNPNFCIEVTVQSRGDDAANNDVLKEVTVNVYRDQTPSVSTDAPNAADLLLTLKTYVARNGI